jgi:hypothetical protein
VPAGATADAREVGVAVDVDGYALPVVTMPGARDIVRRWAGPRARGGDVAEDLLLLHRVHPIAEHEFILRRGGLGEVVEGRIVRGSLPRHAVRRGYRERLLGRGAILGL